MTRILRTTPISSHVERVLLGCHCEPQHRIEFDVVIVDPRIWGVAYRALYRKHVRLLAEHGCKEAIALREAWSGNDSV